jgi:ABC-type transport system involved in cytochrome bd biosynthesis fused ATPase/permease subunit
MAGVPFGFGLILIFFATISYFSMTYPPLSLASALAANNFLRYILASVFPLFITQMYSKLHIDWATTLFAFIALAMVPVPWIFEKWGPTLRQKSVYGFAAMFKKAQEENERLEQLQNEAETELLQNEEDDQKVSNSSASYEHEFKQENVDRV